MIRSIFRPASVRPAGPRRALAGARVAVLLLALIAAFPLRAQDPADETQQMFDAVLRDDLAAVKRHVVAGADVGRRNARGLTAAELAVEIGNIEIANYLLAEEKVRASLPPKPAAEKSPAKSAKKSEPTRAKAESKAAQAPAGTLDTPRDERTLGRDTRVPETMAPSSAAPAAEAPPPRQPRRPRNLFERLADMMRAEPSEPPPAKPESEPPQTPAAITERTAAATQPSPDQPAPGTAASPPADELSPAERIAARVKERQEAERKSLPPPRPAETARPQRSRTVVEWLADLMAGRESRETTRPRMPEGLREPGEMAMARAEPPPPDRPTPGVRDPWAPTVAPSTPSIAPAAPSPPPAVAAAPPPEAAPPSPPTTGPGEAAPGPWAPVVERGGEPQVAALPPTSPDAAKEPPTLFARRKDAPPTKDSGPPGGLFAPSEKKGPPLGAPKASPAPAASTAKGAKGKDAEEGGGLWGSTVEMAQARPLVTAPPAAPPVPETVPTGLGFMIGRSLNLDKTTPPRGETQETGRSCIEKSRGAVVFCVEVANWPQALEPDFTVNTILYTGQQAIVRYDRGQATRMQTLFPSESFDRVVAYFAGHYGPPAEYWTRSIAPLASARRENPTRAWRARNPKTSRIATLEIRKFDDTRGGFPDTRRGVVMLYYQDAPPIFPQVSALELMRLKRPHLPPPEAEGEQPPASGEPAPAKRAQ
ncbi:MAG: hypothetical protein IT564_07170 [Rhodospirillales bacterium]|nr:hypothetical protein [Rhodospirillales bacterium]